MEREVEVQQITVKSSRPISLFAAIMVAAQICHRETGKFEGMLVLETRRESPREVVVAFVKASAMR